MIHKLCKYLVVLSVLTLLSLLTACNSSRFVQDGPPPFPVDASKVPDPIPRTLPRSAYGNLPTYVVNGRRYYVLKTAKGYNARGIASWYGTKFHGRLTSDHERYNMLGMTGASPVLPIPCYVRVTNLRNHRSIIVKINDRGPFAPHRILDLTYVAAKKLGYIGQGTAYVQVTDVDPQYYRAPSRHVMMAKNHHTRRYLAQATMIKDRNVKGGYYLQIGAFSRLANAKNLEAKIKHYTQNPIRISSTDRTHHLYRVQIGPFATMSDTAPIHNRLKAEGLGDAEAVPG